MTTNYTPEVQQMFIEFMLSDATSYARVQNIFNAENFDRSLRGSARFLKEYGDKYKSLPSFDVINASESKGFKVIPEISESYIDWFLTEFEQFTKRQELERAILQASDLLDKGEYGPVEKLIKDAVQISLTRDLGLDYFEDPKARLKSIKENNGDMLTGWPDLDSKLYGGWSRGTLSIVCAISGGGKSLFLQNWALNLVTNGLHGVYITLELSAEMCSMRIDAMLTGKSTRELFKDLDDTELKIKMYGKKSGTLRFKEMPAQSNSNDIKAYLRELEISTGKKPDFICIDYLDLMMPASVKIDPSNLFIKDKYVSEELRNLAKETKAVVLTASQFNRGSSDEVEFDHSNIAGGISKINTADNVFGVFTSRAMRERGQYQLQLLKTRSSAGVGQKVELDFNVESLRITQRTDQSPPGGVSPNSLMSQIKAKSKVTEVIDQDTGEITQVSAIASNVKTNDQATYLQNMLAKLKK